MDINESTSRIVARNINLGLDEFRKYRPMAQPVIKELLTLGQEFKQLFEPIVDYAIERKIKTIAKIEAAGFTRAEAIEITKSAQNISFAPHLGGINNK